MSARRRSADLRAVLAEEHEAHELDARGSSVSAARVDAIATARGELDGIAVDARRDRGERDGAAAERRPRPRASAGGTTRAARARRGSPPRQTGPTVCIDVARRQAARRSSPSRRRSRSRRAAGTPRGSPGPPARWMAPSTPPPPSSDSLAALTIASTTCSVMSPQRDLDASGHRPISIDFADAPTPILPRRARLQRQDAGQGRGAPGRHGVPRPRGRGRAAREERRHPPERRRRADRPRVDGADARRARQRRSTRRGASATSSTSSRARRRRSTASCCRRCRGPITWPSRTTC